jgi:heme/copper-type cytochrome/quinol oxidase subunit 2
VKQTGQGHNQGMMIGAERSFEEYRELCEVLLKNLHLKDKNNLFDFFDSVLLLEGETHESFIDEEDAFFDFEEDDECSFVLYETVKEEKEEENNECDLSVGDFFFNNFFTFNYIRLIRGLQVGYFNHSTRLEIMWTLIPILIIALIITPSFFFMYAIDEDMEALLTVRVIGHQWFWSYSYSFPSYFYDVSGFNMGVKDLKFFWESKNYSFDAYMLDDTYVGAPRLLATDSILILPKYSHINCVVTSSDVIHSWAIPSLGVKVDAVPGRLNRVDLFIEFEGMFFGQCSELCGVNHAFMPIHVQAVSLSDFLRYMLESF